MADGKSTEGLVTARDLAEFLGCSVRTVYRLVAQGLPHIRLGFGERAPFRFQISDVLKWLEATGPDSLDESPTGKENNDGLFQRSRIFIR